MSPAFPAVAGRFSYSKTTQMTAEHRALTDYQILLIILQTT